MYYECTRSLVRFMNKSPICQVLLNIYTYSKGEDRSPEAFTATCSKHISKPHLSSSGSLLALDSQHPWRDECPHTQLSEGFAALFPSWLTASALSSAGTEEVACSGMGIKGKSILCMPGGCIASWPAVGLIELDSEPLLDQVMTCWLSSLGG